MKLPDNILIIKKYFIKVNIVIIFALFIMLMSSGCGNLRTNSESTSKQTTTIASLSPDSSSYTSKQSAGTSSVVAETVYETTEEAIKSEDSKTTEITETTEEIEITENFG